MLTQARGKKIFKISYCQHKTPFRAHAYAPNGEVSSGEEGERLTKSLQGHENIQEKRQIKGPWEYSGVTTYKRADR